MAGVELVANEDLVLRLGLCQSVWHRPDRLLLTREADLARVAAIVDHDARRVAAHMNMSANTS